MSNSKDLKSSLPEDTCSFTIDVQGKLTSYRYVGEFQCKIPNIRKQCEISKHRAYLNGDMADYLDLSTKLVHQMLAHLRFTLIEYPRWWKEADMGYELKDTNVLQAVYDRVMDFEQEWYKEIWGEDESETSETE